MSMEQEQELRVQRLRVEILASLLRECRQYVADSGSDEDPETQTKSAQLLADIDAFLPFVSEGVNWILDEWRRGVCS